jgi:MFS transporter, Spinster family, sphingosine-1-phosphate transporter
MVSSQRPHWLSFRAQSAAPSVWRNNIFWLLGIAAAMIALTAITSAISPRPPLQLGVVAVNPHALQWGVIGFGVFVLVNMMQNLKLTDGEAYRVITGSPTLIMAMAVGSLQGIINYGMMGFNPSFLIRTYDLPMRDAALQFGLVSAAMGIIGPLLWGPLSDRLNIRFPGAGRAWVAMFAMGVSPLLSFWVYHAADPNSFYLRFVAYSLILTGWLPPLYAIIYDQVLPRMRGVTASVYLLASTITGLGIGPYLVGIISDATGDLRTAMLSVNAAAVPIFVLLILIARRVQRDEDGLFERAGPALS